jgi:hypothetical protein
VRRTAQITNAALGIAAAQADESRHESRQRTRARQAVVVNPKPQITVAARRIRREQPAVNVPHRLGVARSAVRVAVLFALPRAVPECRRKPEVRRAARHCARARHGAREQRVDAAKLERGGIPRCGPPDVGARLKHERRGIEGIASRQRREVRRGAREITAVQRVEAGTQGRAIVYGGRSGALKHQQNRREVLHVSVVRR